MRIPAVFLLLSLAAAPVGAQSLVWEDHTKAATVLSNVSLVAGLAWDTVESFRSENRKQALLRQGLAHGIAFGTTFALKNLIKEPRPCGLDCGKDTDYGMPSGHTSAAFASARGWRYSVAISTGYFRVGARKHSIRQVVVGALVGLGSQEVANRIVR